MKTKSQILKEYIAFRSLKNKTTGGLRDIEFHINKFLKHSKKPLEQFNEVMLTKYVQEVNEKYKTNMANTVKASYLKNFIKWHFEDWSSRFRNLAVICQTQKSEPTYNPEDMLSEDDVHKLIKDEETNFWKAYFLTLFYGGCRPIEVINLKWDDVEFSEDGAFITIYSKKNKRTFIKFVPEEVSFYLKKLQDNDSEYIFINPRNKKIITTKGAFWKIGKMSEKSLGKKINLYTLRHSIATIIYNKEGIKDDDIARQMGHTKSMKETYVHNDRGKLKETARRIYFNPQELPPEKKHELELEIEELKKKGNDREKRYMAMMDDLINEVRTKHKLKVGKEIKELAKHIK
jgi:integrase